MSFSKKFGKRFLILVFASFLIYSFLGGDYGLLHWRKLEKEKKELELEAKKYQIKIMELEDLKHKLQSDPYYIEKQAREKLGMSKKTEKVYKFYPPDTTTLPQQ